MELKLEPVEVSGTLSVSDGKEIYQEGGGVTDYEKLDNLPTLDGEIIIGAMTEKAPTVPAWAKTEAKPVYDYEDGEPEEDAEDIPADEALSILLGGEQN